ncbi:efflux RND transporter periplasmic adaptor subunit [Mesorhizobium sp. L-8-3]|uniref:efflux RND transporter periplasmic adaptor subunit n=1 Tax=Mesorhizobium sp. L-8-3 TaxID=2744522 RepID=UPI001927EC1C|nr:efflux RND transporter periplasmic adaptor subunit [Mesorhizobium sp. L-8-3]BCH21469.1 MexH family multidrug efflux RND transporter periplasmic adaptor subunit [Mesorhizobium sp. L-8-3]
MIKRFIIAFILLALVVGGLVGFNIFRDNAIKQFFANMPVQPVTVSTTTVKPITWKPGIEAIGTVSAARGVDLTVETSGVIKDIRFHSNEKVEQGAVLLQLDDGVEKADLDATKAQAALDQTALARAIELKDRGVGSQVTLDVARATATASEAQVNKLQAVLDQKQLRAPFSGTVGIPRVDLGQYLSPGTTVATLQDLETMRVDFSVPEQQLNLLRIGQKLHLGPADSNLPFRGMIRGIDPKIDPVTRLVAVRAEVANPEGKLSPGQFVQVRVELPAEDGVLALPQTALVTSLYGDYVYVVRPAKPADDAPAAAPEEAKGEAKPAEGADAKPADDAKPAGGDEPALTVAQIFVKPGRRSEGLVEVGQGIKPGDQVVTAGQNRLSNGTPVVVDNTIDPTRPANQQAAQR